VYSALRKALPNVKIIQVLHVCDDESVAEAKRIAPLVDALLLDSGNPALAVKQLGGTGRVHNWRLSARINREAGAPVFLAGGLRPGNVVDALATVAPYAVDVCSGVRTGGALDAAKLHDFVRAVAKAAGPGFAPLPS
jgi:phosphoribosylanthranilate isomerase